MCSCNADFFTIELKFSEGKSIKLFLPDSEIIPINVVISFLIPRLLNDSANIRSPGEKFGFIPPAAFVINIFLQPAL